jgi:hypothetical protein
MMVAIRIMLYYQASRGLYYTQGADTALGTDVPAPNFELIDDLRMQSYDVASFQFLGRSFQGSGFLSCS